MALQGILYGLGLPGFQALGIDEFFDVEPLSFAINVESTDITAKKQVRGVTTTSGSANVENIFTATVTIEAISWTALQFAFGVKQAISANLVLPDVKTAIISSAGEIVDTDIKIVVGPPAFTSVGKVWVVDPEAETAYTPISTGSPTTTQFRVDGAANKLIFNTDQAGKTVKYRQLTQYASITGIGFDATAAKFKSISFSGLYYGNDGVAGKIIIPSMTLIQQSGLSLSGEQTSLELEYRLNLTAGRDMPFQLIKLHV